MSCTVPQIVNDTSELERVVGVWELGRVCRVQIEGVTRSLERVCEENGG